MGEVPGYILRKGRWYEEYIEENTQTFLIV